eukprot:997244-Rhodomonas_salina.4
MLNQRVRNLGDGCICFVFWGRERAKRKASDKGTEEESEKKRQRHGESDYLDVSGEFEAGCDGAGEHLEEVGVVEEEEFDARVEQLVVDPQHLLHRAARPHASRRVMSRQHQLRVCKTRAASVNRGPSTRSHPATRPGGAHILLEDVPAVLHDVDEQVVLQRLHEVQHPRPALARCEFSV